MHYLFIKFSTVFFFTFCLFGFYNEIHSIEWLMMFDIFLYLILWDGGYFGSILFNRSSTTSDILAMLTNLVSKYYLDKCNKVRGNVVLQCITLYAHTIFFILYRESSKVSVILCFVFSALFVFGAISLLIPYTNRTEGLCLQYQMKQAN